MGSKTGGMGRICIPFSYTLPERRPFGTGGGGSLSLRNKISHLAPHLSDLHLWLEGGHQARGPAAHPEVLLRRRVAEQHCDAVRLPRHEG